MITINFSVSHFDVTLWVSDSYQNRSIISVVNSHHLKCRSGIIQSGFAIYRVDWHAKNPGSLSFQKVNQLPEFTIHDDHALSSIPTSFILSALPS